MKKPWLIIGIMLAINGGLWHFFIANYWTLRIPKDWSFQAEYLGTIAYPDEAGRLPEKSTINIYRRHLYVKEWEPEQAVIRESYSIYDIHTGAATWQVKLEFKVNPETGQIIDYPGHPEASGLYYLFPKSLEKKDYQHFNYYLNAYTLSYDREESIGDLLVYVYRFSGMLDFTEIYKGSDEFPGLIPLPGQRIRSSDKFVNELWVEPITGEVVKIVEDGPVDYLVDEVTGEKLRPILAWSGKTTGNTVELLAQRASDRRLLLLLHHGVLPGIFLFFGFGCLFIGGWGQIKGSSKKAVNA